jgi:sulfatase modifying factor 1
MSFARTSRVVFMFGVAALLGVPAVPARAVTIDMVPVGNPGNSNDTGGTFNGAVDYEYQIGKYAVTIGQYTAFLKREAGVSECRPLGVARQEPV